MSDACADRRPEPHAANLFDLQAKYAEVVDADLMIAALEGACRTRPGPAA